MQPAGEVVALLRELGREEVRQEDQIRRGAWELFGAHGAAHVLDHVRREFRIEVGLLLPRHEVSRTLVLLAHHFELGCVHWSCACDEAYQIWYSSVSLCDFVLVQSSGLLDRSLNELA